MRNRDLADLRLAARLEDEGANEVIAGFAVEWRVVRAQAGADANLPTRRTVLSSRGKKQLPGFPSAAKDCVEGPTMFPMRPNAKTKDKM